MTRSGEASAFPRRIVFQGLGALGVAAGLAACGGDDGGSGTEATELESGTALAGTADVPVGGGLILTDAQVVITQPAEGEYKAFTAVCTHQSCTVSEVNAQTIDCACHGSKFDVSTGEPVAGPATSALREVPITVDGDQILAT